MNLPSFKQVVVSSTSDALTIARQLMSFVAAVRESIAPLLARPRAFSTVQTVTFVSLTPKKVNHLLPLKAGQTPSGWLITDTDTAIQTRRVSWDDKTIELETTANAEVQLEVW